MQPLLLLLGFILLPGAQAGKIIGGREARPHSHPYMAFLQVESPEGLSSCGGFLVREDFVMTAGHCWGSAINVTLGAHNIEKQERTQQQVTVLRAIRHPKYNETNALNDIMLLQLRNRVTRNRFVRPVALPKAREKPRPGALCTVAGWGWVNLHRWSDKLQDVQLRVQRDRKCTCRFPSYNSQTEICVGDPRQRKAAFKGDSGGPLVCNNVVQGIVSYGDKEHGTTPEVFTRISSYLPWINKTMRCFQSAAAD
ncbi:cathepsin G [Fukomys damarensis]|uniref:Cathepsin G n=1 Tax=Fukomys damarensis TaxID=885580 RepID=A0A091DP86_FUKDA|nr:cathepsin G [Fukomys damarensis]KFO32100.1 Cathepsin G [Fukomys damarensis]